MRNKTVILITYIKMSDPISKLKYLPWASSGSPWVLTTGCPGKKGAKWALTPIGPIPGPPNEKEKPPFVKSSESISAASIPLRPP